MKTFIYTTLFFLLTMVGYAQKSNVIFYCDEGESFYVLINGVKQNEEAASNVKVTDLNQPYYKVKILFKNEFILPLEKGMAPEAGTEAVVAIKKNKKGAFVMRLQSQTSISDTQPVDNQEVVVYQTESTSSSNNTNTNSTNTNVNTNTNTTQENININITTTTPDNTNNTVGFNMNVNITDNTNTNTNTNDNNFNNSNEQPTEIKNGKIVTKCAGAMPATAFSEAKQSIESKGFDESKLTLAKQIARNNCLTAAQVKEIMETFGFEETKLDFAKFAYEYTLDKSNYYKINDAFSFESSIDELNEYIEKK